MIGAVAAASARLRVALLSWPAFRRLSVVQTAHAAGDAMVTVALANTLFFSIPVGEARGKVAFYLALTMAPFAVVSPFIGPWLDRRSAGYRTAIMAAGAGRAVLAILLSGRTDRPVLYPMAFALLVLSRVHGVARSALVPDALPPGKRVMWANAWLAVLSVVGGLGGAGVAVGATALFDQDLALWVSAAAFAALVVPAVRLPRRTGGTAAPCPAIDAYRLLLSSRLLAGGVALATTRAAVGFLTFGLAFLLRVEGQGNQGFAVVIAAGAIGGFIGSVVAPRLQSALKEPLMMLGCLVLIVICGAWAAASFDVIRAVVLAAAVGLSAAMGRLAFDSLLQTDAPSAARGRTFARYEAIFQIWWVGGAALATAVPFGPSEAMWTVSGITAVGLCLAARGFRGPERPGST